MVLQLRYDILVATWHMFMLLACKLNEHSIGATSWHHCADPSPCVFSSTWSLSCFSLQKPVILSFEWENMLPKERYILNCIFKSRGNIWIVNTKDSILNYTGHRDKEIWGKNRCHCVTVEILGSWIRLPKEQTWDKGGLLWAPSKFPGLVMITAKLASASLQLSLQLRCRSINRNVSLL